MFVYTLEMVLKTINTNNYYNHNMCSLLLHRIDHLIIAYMHKYTFLNINTTLASINKRTKYN